MKISDSNLSNFFKNIPSNIRSILIYGYDYGMVYERLKTLQNILEEKHKGAVINKFTYEDIKNNKVDLEIITRNLSFFSNFKIIIIEDIPLKLEKNIEKVIDELPQELFLIFLGKELPASSGIRKYFENGKNSAVIPCYKDSEAAIKKIAISIFNEHQKKYKDEVLNFIAIYLKGDRKNLINELKKVVTYVGNREEVTLNDIKLCSSASIDISCDDLCHALGSKNIINSLDFFYKLNEKNVSTITIMRSVSNYFLRLYYVKKKSLNGENTRTSIKDLIPPIFAMHTEIFLNHVNNFCIDELESILLQLHKLESMSKKTNAPLNHLSDRMLQLITTKQIKSIC